MRGLPKAYQEVSYIESNGTNWLNLDRTHNNDDVYELEVSFPYAPIQTYYKVFGAAASNYSSNDCIQLEADDNDGGFHFRIVWYPEYGKNFGFIEIGKRYKIKIDKNSATSWDEAGNVNGSASYSGNLAATPTKKDYLFSVNSSETSAHACKCRIYSFKITRNSTISRDLVPCYHKDSNMIGFYDLVNNRFYSNVEQSFSALGGSDPFTYGIEEEEEQNYENFVVNCGSKTVTKNVPTESSGSKDATLDSSSTGRGSYAYRWYTTINPSNTVFDIKQYSVVTPTGYPLDDIRWHWTGSNSFLIEGFTDSMLRGATVTYTYRYLTQQQVTQGETWPTIYCGNSTYNTYTYTTTYGNKNFTSGAMCDWWTGDSWATGSDAMDCKFIDHGSSHTGYPYRYEGRFIITQSMNSNYEYEAVYVEQVHLYVQDESTSTIREMDIYGDEDPGIDAKICKVYNSVGLSPRVWDAILVSFFIPYDTYKPQSVSSRRPVTINYEYQKVNTKTSTLVGEKFGIMSDIVKASAPILDNIELESEVESTAFYVYCTNSNTQALDISIANITIVTSSATYDIDDWENEGWYEPAIDGNSVNGTIFGFDDGCAIEEVYIEFEFSYNGESLGTLEVTY